MVELALLTEVVDLRTDPLGLLIAGQPGHISDREFVRVHAGIEVTVRHGDAVGSRHGRRAHLAHLQTIVRKISHHLVVDLAPLPVHHRATASLAGG